MNNTVHDRAVYINKQHHSLRAIIAIFHLISRLGGTHQQVINCLFSRVLLFAQRAAANSESAQGNCIEIINIMLSKMVDLLISSDVYR